MESPLYAATSECSPAHGNEETVVVPTPGVADVDEPSAMVASCVVAGTLAPGH